MKAVADRIPVVATGHEYDVFISHASEDKDDVARPLFGALTARGLRVWLDEAELTIGDSLGQKIDEGLARSRFGVVVLSQHFFKKRWTRLELDGLVARETTDGEKVILPVWHGVTAREVAEHSPTLAARLAANTEDGMDTVANQVVRALERAIHAVPDVGDRAEAAAQPMSRDVLEPGVGPNDPAAGVSSEPAVVVDSAEGPLRFEGDPGVVRDSVEAGRRGAAPPSEPGALHDAVLGYLQDKNSIALDQLLRAERAAFQRAVTSVTDDYVNKHVDDETVRDAGSRLAVAAERRTSSLIPLGLYRPGGIAAELRAHAGWMSRTQLHAGGMTWQQPWRLPFWVIGMTLGGLYCRLERFEPVGEILAARWANQYDTDEPFVGHPGEPADAVGKLLGPSPPNGQSWVLPVWQWLVELVAGFSWLEERYPEWLGADGEPGAGFAEFDMLRSLASGFRNGFMVFSFWSIEGNGARSFARRLYSDESVRAEVAGAVGVDLERFDADAPKILAEAHAVGHFPPNLEVANILQTGSAR
jgi:hypothetical protein